ncbi:hypothetical protein AAHE18_20G105300 [Arachis hypogaea]
MYSKVEGNDRVYNALKGNYYSGTHHGIIHIYIPSFQIRTQTMMMIGPITTKKYLRFIEEKNPTICYSKKSSKLLKLKPPRHVECTLCLSEFMEGEKLRSLKCQHTFHRDCLDTWLKDYCATCPLCRLKVVSDDVVSQHRELRKQADSNGNGEQLTYFLAVLRGGNTLQS